jgi:hypothetical protein
MDERLARANHLEGIQRQLRGSIPWTFEGKHVRVVGPYEATDKNEARAAEIVRLRREAAR